MAESDNTPRQDLRMIADAKTWLPTDDTEARHSIVAGVDPIAAGAPPERRRSNSQPMRSGDALPTPTPRYPWRHCAGSPSAAGNPLFLSQRDR